MLDLLPKECLSSQTERCTSVDVATLSAEKDASVCQILCHVVICWLFTLFTCGELSCWLKFQGLWVVWLRAKYLWSGPTIYKDCRLSCCPAQQELSSRTWLMHSQLHGAVWAVAVPCQTVFAVLRRCLVLHFSFVFLFWLFYFFPEHTALCRALPWETTLPTGAVHKTLLVILYGNSGLWLCTGAVILLTCPSG